jgi:hypothetical protein
LSNLKELDFSEASFACEGMKEEEDDEGNIVVRTADSTFANAILTNLTNLNLTGTVFAAKDMTSEGDIHTAYKTFANADLSNLITLDLSKSIFAETEMTTSGYVYTGSQTFSVAEMPNVENAYLTKGNDDAVFAAINMTKYGDANTGYHTFEDANLSKIPEATADGGIQEDGMFEIEAETLSEEANEYIKVDTFKNTMFLIVFKPVPITTDFFIIEPEMFEGKEVQAIKGFKEEVKQSVSTGVFLLKSYNSLDFSFHAEGKPICNYVSGRCEFDPNVMDA